MQGSFILSQQNHLTLRNAADGFHLDVDLPGSAELSPGGTTGRLTVLGDDDLSPLTIQEHVNFGKSSAKDAESPFGLLPENYPSDASLDNDYDATHPQKHIEMITLSAAEGPINLHKNIDVDISPEFPNKIEKAAEELFESTRVDMASINCSQLGTSLKETDTVCSVQELVNENGDESHDKGSVKAVPSVETFTEGHFKSATEYNNDSPHTLKENKDHNFRSSPTAVKVDEFGRLVREGISDSNSDDSYHASDHNRRGINHGRDHSRGCRRRRNDGECVWREKRSLSRRYSLSTTPPSLSLSLSQILVS